MYVSSASESRFEEDQSIPMFTPSVSIRGLWCVYVIETVSLSIEVGCTIFANVLSIDLRHIRISRSERGFRDLCMEYRRNIRMFDYGAVKYVAIHGKIT